MTLLFKIQETFLVWSLKSKGNNPKNFGSLLLVLCFLKKKQLKTIFYIAKRNQFFLNFNFDIFFDFTKYVL